MIQAVYVKRPHWTEEFEELFFGVSKKVFYNGRLLLVAQRIEDHENTGGVVYGEMINPSQRTNPRPTEILKIDVNTISEEEQGAIRDFLLRDGHLEGTYVSFW